MKYKDVIQLHELDLITAEQKQRIIERFRLREEPGRLLVVLSVFGALLVASGVVLLISANWEVIPRGVKLAAGILLMLGAWAGGWRLRESSGHHPKSGEALYLVGAGLWLANIALVGQIYHLSSRPPNAILLWAAGIAPLPWLLRSKALFVLSLLAVWLWVGMEVNDRGSRLGGLEENQVLLYSMIGLVVLGWGMCLRAGRWTEFSGPAEKTGLLALLAGIYPLCWLDWGAKPLTPGALGLLAAVTAAALALTAFGLRHRLAELSPQWRWTWGASLAGLAGAGWLWLFSGSRDGGGIYGGETPWAAWLVNVALVIHCLLQVQVGAALRSRFLVNLAVFFLALAIITAYLRLFGSMAVTGGMFVVSGVFLIGLAIYLERKRRSLLSRMRQPAPAR
jgi:uncharacterized membrane protein